MAMGIDFSGIVEAKPCQLSDFKGKAIAIDGYNSLYQFLSSIRQRDGTPLMDTKMRVTSHLSGAFQRTASLLEKGQNCFLFLLGQTHNRNIMGHFFNM